MSRRPAVRSERGFTLIEVLLVSTLFLVILGATLDSMVRFTRINRTAEQHNDRAETARTALDRNARQLRNLAKRVTVPTIAKATAYDFVFQTSDPARTWVRYCLDTTAPPATPGDGRLWEMATSSAGVPDTSTCPGTTSAWEQAAVVSSSIVNRADGVDRPVFRFSCLREATPCPPPDLSAVTGVTSTLFVDDDVRRAPAELRVTTSVFLRNQNSSPTADFSWNRAGTRRVLLNGSASSDPEGRTLRFYWYPSATAPAFNCADGPPRTPNFFQGITLSYTFPTTVPLGASQPFTLVVCDPGDLKGGPVTKYVQVPS